VTTLALPPRAEIVRDDSSGSRRLYRVIMIEADGTERPVEDYWSVTTLLKGMPNQALVGWAARETSIAALTDLDYWKNEVDRWGFEDTRKRLAKVMYNKSGRKADLGTLVHRQIEARILDAEPPSIPDYARDAVASYLKQFDRFVTNFAPEFTASELVVCNPEHRWAGTLDAIATIRGRSLLLDFKTTKPAGQNEDKPGVWLEHAAQIAAYRRAQFAVDRQGSVHAMPETEGGCALWLNPDRYALLELDTGDRMYRLFRLAAEVFLAVDTQRSGWFIERELTPQPNGDSGGEPAE